MDTPQEKLFNKGFVSITIINFIVYLVYYLLMVIIAVIAQDNLNATLSQAGLASGIYIIGTLISRLFMGKKLEIYGRKGVLRYGALFYLATTIAYLFIPNIMVMYLGQCIEKAPAEEIFRNPLHPYTKALLRAIPKTDLSCRKEKSQIIRGEVVSPVNPAPGCRFASRCEHCTEKCTEHDFALRELSPNHFVACNLYEK